MSAVTVDFIRMGGKNLHVKTGSFCLDSVRTDDTAYFLSDGRLSYGQDSSLLLYSSNTLGTKK